MTFDLNAALIGDAVVNLFGAAGTLLVSSGAYRADPKGPITKRLVFALRLVSLLFLLRGLAWLTGSYALDRIAVILAGFAPLASLVLAEGLMRRHAPLYMKLAISGGAAFVAAVAFLPIATTPTPLVGLLVVVLGGFLSIAFLLWRRDTSSLSATENRTIKRLLIALACLAPLIVTDFRSIWPEMPVRLGALGALIVLYAGFGPGGLTVSGRSRGVSLASLTAVSVIMAVSYIGMAAIDELDQIIRATAVALAGLVFSALMAETLAVRGEQGNLSSPLLAARTAPEFLDGLKSHPLLRDALLLEGHNIEHVSHATFEELVIRHPILRRSEAPWGRPVDDEGVERALSLLEAYEATHIVRLSVSPIRLLAFALPPFASDTRTEGEISSARRIGELIYANGSLR